MKASAFLSSLAALFLFSGCSEKSTLTQPRVNNPQAPLLGVNWEPASEIYSVSSADENVRILDVSAPEETPADPSPVKAWTPRTNNGKLNLVWWNNMENAPTVIETQTRISWKDGDGPWHEAWVTPVRWDGVGPAVSRDENDIPIVYQAFSMSEYLASRASNNPGGKTGLKFSFGENVQDWPAVWRRVAEELSIYLPAAVKWATHDTDLATYKSLWGEDSYNWDVIYPYLVRENFGL